MTANNQTVLVSVFNIEYDTVAKGVDYRSQLTASDIPESVSLVLDDIDDESDIPHRVLKEIERNWLVDRFDWQTCSAVHHAECAVRATYGVSIFDEWKNDPARSRPKSRRSLRKLYGRR